MVRIFPPLAFASLFLLVLAFALGWRIDDPRIPDPAIQREVQNHLLLALAALCFTTLVHAIVLTYFMGTGRWIEETSNAYRLSPEFFARNQQLKYRIIPVMVGAFLLLLATGAFGAAADPASPLGFEGWGGFSPALLHSALAMTALAANTLVHYLEFLALYENSQIVAQVLREVRRIRLEKGLAV